MEIRIDPDTETKENLNLTIKILQAKYNDRFETNKATTQKDLETQLLKLIEDQKKSYSKSTLQMKLNVSKPEFEKALDSLKRNGDVFEPKRNEVKRIQ